MQSPIQQGNQLILDAVSTAANQASEVQNVREIKGYALDYSWTSGTTRTGTLTLEASNSESGPFSPIDTYTMDTNSGSRLINVEIVNYSYIRVRFTNLTGTGGTLSAILSTKRY